MSVVPGSIANLYSGVNRGGVSGASGALKGLSGLAGAASGYTPAFGGALSSLGSAAGTAGSGLGVVGGIQQGGVNGYTAAGLNAAQLGSKSGVFGSNTSAVNAGAGDAANALGIYNGIKQGGVGGYSGAAVNAAQLGSKAGVFGGASGAVGSAAGYAAIPLALYNEVKNWQSGATGSDAMAGAATGAAIGSVVPVVGTAIGALVGGAAGALSSAFGNGKVDAENANWEGYTKAYNQDPNVATQVQNPYGALAGLFDLRSNQVTGDIPFYNQYGRMGEQQFTTDLTGKIQGAEDSGAVTHNPDGSVTFKTDANGLNPQGQGSVTYSAKDAPSAVYNEVVQPWIDSMGKWDDPNKSAQQALLTQMTGQYINGEAGQDWQAVGGDSPFASLSPQTSQAGTSVAKAGNKGVQKAADGGRAKRKAKLDGIRPKRSYDDGGGVDFGSDYNPGAAIDFNSIMDGGTGNDTTDMSNYLGGGAGGIGEQIAGNTATDNALGDWLTQYEANNPTTATGTKTGAKGSTGSLGSIAKSAAPYAALLPIISSLVNKPSTGSTALPSSQSTGPTMPFQAQSSPRTANAVDPNTDWYTYGQHPETQFFSNNSIGSLMGPFAAPAASQPTPTTPGSPTMNTQPVTAPRPALKARGGALGSLADDTPLSNGTEATGESRHVRGPGDGTSDDIDAKLSDGEYVFDANTVSMLGNGSNDAGAKRLDQLRQNLRKHAAKPMAKGKQFMKAKKPEAYMGGK